MDKDTITILEWVDSANLSRTKKNLARDFSDGVLMAELLKVHIPQFVEIHNYITSSNSKQKKANWLLLNNKILNKIGYDLSDEEINFLVNAQNNYIETVLKSVYILLKKFKSNPHNYLVEKYRSKSPENINSKYKLTKPKASLDPSKEQHYISVIKEKDNNIESLKNRIKALETEIMYLKGRGGN